VEQTLDNIIDRQHRIIQFGIAGIAALVGFAESRGDRTVAMVVYGVVPVAISALLRLWFGEIDRLRDLEANTKEDADGNRLRAIVCDELRRAGRIHTAVQSFSLFASLLAGVLAVRDLRGIEAPEGTYDPIWVVVFAVYWVAAVGLVVWTAVGVRRPKTGG
jgi:hypothetical protein